MMQVFVKGSKEALELYKKAFNADVLCEYPDGNGGYMHAEINAFRQRFVPQLVLRSSWQQIVMSGLETDISFRFPCQARE